LAFVIAVYEFSRYEMRGMGILGFVFAKQSLGDERFKCIALSVVLF
jgi:hypothetical protein